MLLFVEDTDSFMLNCSFLGWMKKDVVKTEATKYIKVWGALHLPLLLISSLFGMCFTWHTFLSRLSSPFCVFTQSLFANCFLLNDTLVGRLVSQREAHPACTSGQGHHEEPSNQSRKSRSLNLFASHHGRQTRGCRNIFMSGQLSLLSNHEIEQQRSKSSSLIMHVWGALLPVILLLSHLLPFYSWQSRYNRASVQQEEEQEVLEWKWDVILSYSDAIVITRPR